MPQCEVLVIEGSTWVVDIRAACAVAVDDIPALAHEAFDLWFVELVSQNNRHTRRRLLSMTPQNRADTNCQHLPSIMM
jgi:hypothetical protein